MASVIPTIDQVCVCACVYDILTSINRPTAVYARPTAALADMKLQCVFC